MKWGAISDSYISKDAVMSILKAYLSGNIFLGVICFILILWLSFNSEAGWGRGLTRIAKLLLFAVLAINILANIALLTHDIPPRAAGYRVGDGLCDYSGQPASIGLIEHIRGKYIEGGEALLFIEYEVRPLGDLGNNRLVYGVRPPGDERSDRLVDEYASRLEWLATLDMERMSNGWLIKSMILAVSIAFLVMAGYWGGMGDSLRGTRGERVPFEESRRTSPP